jgi:hypothetical protein
MPNKGLFINCVWFVFNKLINIKLYTARFFNLLIVVFNNDSYKHLLDTLYIVRSGSLKKFFICFYTVSTGPIITTNLNNL